MSHDLDLDRRGFLAASLAIPSFARAAGRRRVRTGLDIVVEGRRDPFKGKRVGLLVHAASLTADGRHAIDALTACGISVVKLFGAEHGFRGLAAAGESVDDRMDVTSGLPVISLYGKKVKPAPEDLEGLDMFMVDMQDAGVRFYTFASTVMHCLDACAEALLPMLVLDRPNPLGGQRMEGPVSAPERDVPRSLVNMTPGPLVHGLTMAEIAGVVNASRERKAQLGAVRLTGWSRGMSWADTGLTWVNPSPNLRSAHACLAYPGTCLLEGTTATEGRGTDAPFLKVGAPWLKSAEMARAVRVPGFTCEPTTFTPRSSTAAPTPKHLNVVCQGLDIRVSDDRKAQPYRLGVTLLVEMKRRHPEFGWLRDGSGLDRLVGTRSLRVAIDRGDPADAILASDASAIENFRTSRASSLLY
ncbi:MAG: DUF1343 domain-containing protein [Vicinamibacteria bacterium]|nr:DUF1343 domain-containing protein [Vicinamibacteria bacterium]